ncbi:fatty acid synthase [Trichonephila clavata]|uniref:Fatty acid synthase n=1 Tax=Trichonephila clavata TaxID=2740835 RepID=A0A8X6FH53_TRICU|nr:fatty acid synthase [Trichonephila clavata]
MQGMGETFYTNKYINNNNFFQIRDEEPQIKATPKPVRLVANPRTSFDSERSYIIIGGLGGFGLELCRWMVERGAKHILLTSRSGIRNGYQRLCMSRWKKEGKNIIVSTENAANLKEAKQLLQRAAAIKPVGGIFNLALVLRDAFMENQTVKNFEEVCDSKVSSTMNLDALSRDLCLSLQWFVCFSSVSCGRGNAGQTNYGYANSVMERICEHRTQEGLPGLAIQWGPIGDVGILQETVGSDVVISGTISQSIRSCLSVLDKFLQQKHPVVLSCVPYLPENISSTKTSKTSVLSAVGKIFGAGYTLSTVAEIENCRRSCRLQSLSPEFGLLVSPTRCKSPKDMSQDSKFQTFPIFHLVQPARASSIFHGEAGDDPSRWLKEYERIAKFNRWDDTMCLTNAYSFLKGTARLWYENNEVNLSSWEKFQEQLKIAYGSTELFIKQVERELKNRAQKRVRAHSPVFKVI